MGLTELPPEILGMIIDEVHPEDLDSFTSCCRTTYDHSERRRTVHRYLKRRYSKVTIDAKSSDTCIFHVLDAMQREPIAFRYCRDLTFKPYCSRYSCGPEDDVGSRPNNHREMVSNINFSALLDRCGWLDYGTRAAWNAALLSMEEGKALILLLALLPNVEILTLGGMIPYLLELGTLLARITTPDMNHYNLTLSQHSIPLQRLRVLYVPAGIGLFHLSLWAVGRFTLLPSLKIITCRWENQSCHKKTELKRRSRSKTGSLVEYIDLRLSGGNPEHLLDFIKPLVNLRELKCAYIRPPCSTSLDAGKWKKDFQNVAADWMSESGFAIRFDPIPPRPKWIRVVDRRQCVFVMWRGRQVLPRAAKSSQV